MQLCDAGEDVTIRVHNAGAPIPPDEIPHVFDAFRRGRSERDPQGGLGLGLFIANQIVRSHGGHIDVASSDEHGTTFQVTLPRHAPSKSAAPHT
jgi:sigma-B regulation protein RsbU (phosphoserine phosphatase)